MDDQGSITTTARLAPTITDALRWGQEQANEGNWIEAIAVYRQVLANHPTNVDALYLLGMAFTSLGRHDEALEACARAVRLRPDLAALRNNLGRALRALDRIDDARAAYLEAIRLDPTLAVAHANLGLIALRDERYDEAHRMLSRAVNLEPERAVFWQYLADCYLATGEMKAEIRCRERVLERTPEPTSHAILALARALHEANRLEEAETSYQKATEVDSSSAAPWIELGAFLKERGEFEQSEAAFRTAIRNEPTNDRAHACLATLLRHRLPAADLQLLLARLGDSSARADESRAQLLFALGQWYDLADEHARAAELLREANAAKYRLIHGEGPVSTTGQEEFADQLIRVFDAEFFERMQGAGLDTRRPVFIVGLPRSGTTVLEQILASHSQIHGAGELLLIRRLFDSLPSMLEPSRSAVECIPHLTPAMIRRFATTHLKRLRVATSDTPADRIIDKMPGNYYYLGLIHTFFPNALVIHARRDIRDVAFSCWLNDFVTMNWTNHPATIADYFRSYKKLMKHWEETLPMTMLEVDYEDTVSDLETVARRVIAAMGLEWEPACLDFHRTRRLVRTGSVVQVRQPLYQRSAGRWKCYESLIPELFEALPG